jgi:xanthine/uracil permease
MADFAVTVLGVVGFLGFLLAGRMDDANVSPFDVFAFVWFFTFGGIKFCLPSLLSRRAAGKRDSGPRAVGSALGSWRSQKR